MGCSSSRGRRTRSVKIAEEALEKIAEEALEEIVDDTATKRRALEIVLDLEDEALDIVRIAEHATETVTKSGGHLVANSARHATETVAKRHATGTLAKSAGHATGTIAKSAGQAVGARARNAGQPSETPAGGVEIASPKSEAPASPKPHLPDLESDERGTNVPDAALANWGLLGGAELEPPLASKAMLLLDAKWLVGAQTKRGLDPRQMLPDKAFMSLSEVKSATHPSILRIVCVSHCWLHAEHPDPKGTNLKNLKGALKNLLREGDPDLEPWCGSGWGVLYDFCSLHQPIYQAKLAFQKKSSLVAAFQKEGGAHLPADWRLATHDEVRQNWEEVRKKLGTSDVCMLADHWKVDGTGNDCSVTQQERHESLGDAIFVKGCRNQTRFPQRPAPRPREGDEERRIRLEGMSRLEPEETKMFEDALKNIGHFFSHQSTLVLLLNMQRSDYIVDDFDARTTALNRGWCACEAGLAMMVKAPSRVLDLDRILIANEGHAERAFQRSDQESGGDVSHGDSGKTWQERCPQKWQALEIPDAFQARLEKLSFSSPERDKSIVEALYREAFHHRLQSVHALEYQSLGWDGVHGVSAAKALAKVAESGCAAHLHALAIRGNKLGDEGARVLALALGSGSLERLQELNLNESGIGDDGATALAEAMTAKEGHRLPLVELSLEGNRIGDDGAAAIAAAVESGGVPALQRLDLEGNGIGDRGARALGRALPYVPELRELWLHGNEFRPAGRDVLRSAWAPRDPSDLWV